jgi:hypothetical protein
VRADSPLAKGALVMEKNNAFRLSRIQAEGWNAARKFLLADLDDRKIAALNPYKEASEKARWHTGFTGALEAAGTK